MKYCTKCGTALDDQATFCSSCGTRQTAGPAAAGTGPIPHIPTPPMPHIPTPPMPRVPTPPVPTPPAPPAKKGRGANGLGIAGFILGIIGLIFSWIPAINVVALVVAILGGVLSLIGIITGIVARKRLGLAITGFILCDFAILVATVVIETILQNGF